MSVQGRTSTDTLVGTASEPISGFARNVSLLRQPPKPRLIDIRPRSTGKVPKKSELFTANKEGASQLIDDALNVDGCSEGVTGAKTLSSQQTRMPSSFNLQSSVQESRVQSIPELNGNTSHLTIQHPIKRSCIPVRMSQSTQVSIETEVKAISVPKSIHLSAEHHTLSGPNPDRMFERRMKHPKARTMSTPVTPTVPLKSNGTHGSMSKSAKRQAVELSKTQSIGYATRAGSCVSETDENAQPTPRVKRISSLHPSSSFGPVLTVFPEAERVIMGELSPNACDQFAESASYSNQWTYDSTASQISERAFAYEPVDSTHSLLKLHARKVEQRTMPHSGESQNFPDENMDGGRMLGASDDTLLPDSFQTLHRGRSEESRVDPYDFKGSLPIAINGDEQNNSLPFKLSGAVTKTISECSWTKAFSGEPNPAISVVQEHEEEALKGESRLSKGVKLRNISSRACHRMRPSIMTADYAKTQSDRIISGVRDSHEICRRTLTLCDRLLGPPQGRNMQSPIFVLYSTGGTNTQAVNPPTKPS